MIIALSVLGIALSLLINSIGFLIILKLVNFFGDKNDNGIPDS
jgi:hypothetical protein